MLFHPITASKGELRLLSVNTAAYQEAALPPGEVTGGVRAAAEVAEVQRRVCQRVTVFASGAEAGSRYGAINRVGVFFLEAL